MSFIPLLFYFIVIIPSAIIHEYAHGWMANQLGDPTAKLKGRLSLDPRVHVDPFGTLLLPVILFLSSSSLGFPMLFAYAKPVPINPYNLDDQRWGPMWTALAGPASNFILAAIFGIFSQLFPQPISMFFEIIVLANVLLGVFNMVPIPPLDGSKVLFALLPDQYYELKQKMERYKFIILLLFIFFGFGLISPIISVLTNLFTGGSVLF